LDLIELILCSIYQ